MTVSAAGAGRPAGYSEREKGQGQSPYVGQEVPRIGQKGQAVGEKPTQRLGDEESEDYPQRDF